MARTPERQADTAVPDQASRPASPRLVLILIVAGLGALLGAWVPATQPFGAPDEPDHYLRAMSLVNGRLLGPKVPWVDPTLSRAQRAWATADARGVSVTRSLAPPGRLCVNGSPPVPKSQCLIATHTGDYNPLSYALPAAALAVSDTAHRGLLLGRGVFALESAAFLVLAFLLMWSGSMWSILGLLLSLSPMVLFVNSVMNPNGLQIAAAVAFASALLRIARNPDCSARWTWAALTVSGAVTVLS